MSHPAVDQERCIGCGLCERICPEVFALQDEQSNVTGQDACDSCDGEDSVE